MAADPQLVEAIDDFTDRFGTWLRYRNSHTNIQGINKVFSEQFQKAPPDRKRMIAFHFVALARARSYFLGIFEDWLQITFGVKDRFEILGLEMEWLDNLAHDFEDNIQPEDPRVLKGLIWARVPFPCAAGAIRWLTALGVHPTYIAGRRVLYGPDSATLTNREAIEWVSCTGLSMFINNPKLWLAVKYLGKQDNIYRAQVSKFDEGVVLSTSGDALRIPDLDERIIRWLIGAWHDPPRKAALIRERTVMNPVTHRLVEDGPIVFHITEVLPEDLVKSVDRTFAGAIERQRKEAEAFALTQNEPLIEKPKWWTDQPYAKMLLTPAELTKEGQECSHCVSNYAERVKGGDSLIISINLPRNCRSTIELVLWARDPDRDNFLDWSLRQHYAPNNRSPHENCVKYWNQIKAALEKNALPFDLIPSTKKKPGLEGYSVSTKRLTRKQLSELPIVKMRVL